MNVGEIAPVPDQLGRFRGNIAADCRKLVWGHAMSIEFLLTSLVVIVLPGTGVVLTLAAALSRGFAWSAR
jgi:hypothetical protein